MIFFQDLSKNILTVNPQQFLKSERKYMKISLLNS